MTKTEKAALSWAYQAEERAILRGNDEMANHLRTLLRLAKRADAKYLPEDTLRCAHMLMQDSPADRAAAKKAAEAALRGLVSK